MRVSRSAVPLLATLVMGAGPATDVAPLPGLAPFGDQVAEQRLPRYHRATPLIGISGPIDDKGVIEAKRLGFATVVDLRNGGADVASERRRAEFARIRYVNIPLQGLPTSAQVKQFADVIGERGNLPMLLHGADIDQSGAMWALYRASVGVPAAVALDDGAAAGLGESSAAVKARLAESGTK